MHFTSLSSLCVPQNLQFHPNGYLLKDITSAATSTSEVIVHDDGKVWDEDKGYRFDNEAVKKSGYESVARAERKGLKGYVLIKPKRFSNEKIRGVPSRLYRL